MKKFLITFITFPLFATFNAQLVVNEYSASNLFTYSDNYGNYVDWFEIYNPTSQEVSLDGYAYANSSNGSDGTYEYWNDFPSGAVIAAGATYVIAHEGADQSILDKANEITTLYHNGNDGH